MLRLNLVASEVSSDTPGTIATPAAAPTPALASPRKGAFRGPPPIIANAVRLYNRTVEKLFALPQQLIEVWCHPLNRGSELAAIARWIRWQLASRVAARPIIVPFVGGTNLFARAGETGVTGNIYYGLAEYEEMAFALHLLRAGDVFVDIGANAGSYSVLASGVTGARTIAFEPIAETADRFEANVRLNQLEERVTLHRLGVGSGSGMLRFTTDRDTVNRVAIDGEAGTEIPIASLDEMLDGLSPTLVKLDVEGFESEVLAGARDTISRPSLLAIIVEINDSFRVYGGTLQQVVQPLEAAGFRPYAYDPATRSLHPLTGPNARAGNTIFVRDESDSLERLRTANPISLRLHSRAIRSMDSLRFRSQPVPAAGSAAKRASW